MTATVAAWVRPHPPSSRWAFDNAGFGEALTVRTPANTDILTPNHYMVGVIPVAS